MGSMAGELTEHERKMTATHLRQRSQVIQGKVFSKIALETLNCSPDVRRNSRPPSLLLYSAKHAQRQCAGKRLEIERTMRGIDLRSPPSEAGTTLPSAWSIAKK